MAEEGEVKVSGGEEKKEGGSLLTKILTIIFFISLFVLLLAGTATSSILMRNFEDRILNAGSGGGNGSGSVCNIPEPYYSIFSKAANKLGVDTAVVASIFYAGEHNNNWPDVNGPWASSDAGASGPFQFMPGTWDTYAADGGGDTYAADPVGTPDGKKNIQSIWDSSYAAAAYLKKLSDQFGGDIQKIAAGYNAGEGAVMQYNGVPPYDETRKYVVRVKAAYEKFKNCSSVAGPISSSGYIWPTAEKGTITGVFNEVRPDHIHGGIDIAVDKGTVVRAVKSGKVTTARDLSPNGAGNAVIIDHGDGTVTEYFHLSQFSVSEGQQVQQGQTIGLSGGKQGDPGAGTSTGPHLHFQININGTPADPMLYLPK